MSKQCETFEDAQATVKHYQSKKDTDATIHEQPNGKYIVRRANDNKVGTQLAVRD